MWGGISLISGGGWGGISLGGGWVSGEGFGGGWGGMSLISGWWYALDSLRFERHRSVDEAKALS